MEEIIENSKKLLLEGLSPYVSDPILFKQICEKISNLKVNILDIEQFNEKYKEFGGKGFFPGAFCYNEELYFKSFDLSEHKIIHEMLHAISNFKDENGFKSGLFVGNKTENYMYGRGFNEGFTEYMVSRITNEGFYGYTYDFKIIIEMFMQISNYNVEDVLRLYFQKDEWLSDSVIDQFDDVNKSLPALVVELDRKSPNSKKKYDPNNVMSIMLNAIENKINIGEHIDGYEISTNLKCLCDYYFHADVILNPEVNNKLAGVMDALGAYTPKEF